MMQRFKPFAFPGVVALASALVLAACGNPSGPSGHGVTLHGALEGDAGSASVSAATSAAKAIVVSVQENPANTSSVGADGTFSLQGLPEGSFTLVFSRGGSELGSLAFEAVERDQDITIRVAISSNGGSIILLEEKRNGVGQGNVLLEGVVEAVISRDPDGDSRFMVDGDVVVARAGYTSIREGNQRRTVNDIEVGIRAHVRGSWLPSPSTASQSVLAADILLDGDFEDQPQGNCMISGGKVGKKIELEGNVAAGSAVAFSMQVNGNRSTGLVDIDAHSATFTCNGGKKLPNGQCQTQVTPGAKIHVSGLLEACDSNAARVDADEVKVQK